MDATNTEATADESFGAMTRQIISRVTGRRARAKARYIELIEAHDPKTAAELEEVAEMIGKDEAEILNDIAIFKKAVDLEQQIVALNAKGVIKAHVDAGRKWEDYKLETERLMAERAKITKELDAAEMAAGSVSHNAQRVDAHFEKLLLDHWELLAPVKSRGVKLQ